MIITQTPLRIGLVVGGTDLLIIVDAVGEAVPSGPNRLIRWPS